MDQIDNRDYRPFRLSDIIPGNEWPDHLQQLVRDPTGNGYDVECPRKISLAEMTALLCHAALVEIGFIPENADISFPVVDLFSMPDSDRIKRFGGRVNDKGYNSDAAVFTWRYQVVNAIVAEVKEPSPPSKDQNATTETETPKLDKIEIKDSEHLSAIEKSPTQPSPSSLDPTTSLMEWMDNEDKLTDYELSPPCDMIMVPKDCGLQIFCNFPGSESTKPFQLSTEVNIRSSMENNTTGLESRRQSGEEWMRMMNLNGLGFSSTFKRTFATLCLDSMNGIMFDLRGLVCLPPELLIKIYAQCDIKTIRNIRLTCRYLHDVANIPGLWRTLIKRRDFGRTPSVPAARFARFFSRVPYELSPSIMDAARDYRSIYEAQRRPNNFRPRFDVMGGLSNRLAPRHSLLPYVTPPRPFFFRLSYDVAPQQPVIHSSSRQYFHQF